MGEYPESRLQVYKTCIRIVAQTYTQMPVGCTHHACCVPWDFWYLKKDLKNFCMTCGSNEFNSDTSCSFTRLTKVAAGVDVNVGATGGVDGITRGGAEFAGFSSGIINFFRGDFIGLVTVESTLSRLRIMKDPSSSLSISMFLLNVRRAESLNFRQAGGWACPKNLPLQP